MNSSHAHQEAFEINMTSDTLIRRDSGSINCHIWLTIGSVAFPSVAWDDFPVVILSWWTEQTLDLLTGQRESGRYNFMDGPNWFVVQLANDRAAKIGLYRYVKTGERCLLETWVDFDVVVGAVLHTAEIVIDACQKRGWVSQDLEVLMANYSQLKSKVG